MKDTHTPHRPIRVESDLWEEFGLIAGTRNRSAILRDFIAWYVRRRGAALPKRPAPAEDEPSES